LRQNSSQYLVFVSSVLEANLAEISLLQQLFNNFHAHCQTLDSDSRRNMYQFSANVFTVFPNVSRCPENVVVERGQQMRIFIQPVINLLQTQVYESVVFAKNIIEGLCRSVSKSSINSKKILYLSLQELIYGYNFSNTNDKQVFLELLDLYILMIKEFVKLISNPKGTIENIYSLLSKINMEANDCDVIDRSLSLFSIVSSDTGKIVASLLPIAITLCCDLEKFNHQTMKSSKTQTMEVFYEFVYCILSNNWRYFFSSGVNVLAGSPTKTEHGQSFLDLVNVRLINIDFDGLFRFQ
jgi:hypothetical protein